MATSPPSPALLLPPPALHSPSPSPRCPSTPRRGGGLLLEHPQSPAALLLAPYAGCAAAAEEHAQRAEQAASSWGGAATTGSSSPHGPRPAAAAAASAATREASVYVSVHRGVLEIDGAAEALRAGSPGDDDDEEGGSRRRVLVLVDSSHNSSSSSRSGSSSRGAGDSDGGGGVLDVTALRLSVARDRRLAHDLLCAGAPLVSAAAAAEDARVACGASLGTAPVELAPSPSPLRKRAQPSPFAAGVRGTTPSLPTLDREGSGSGDGGSWVRAPPPAPSALLPADSPPPLVYQSYVNAAYEPPTLGAAADVAPTLLAAVSASPAVPAAVRRPGSVGAGLEVAAGCSPEDDASAEEGRGAADADADAAAAAAAAEQSDASDSTRTAPGCPASELSAIAAGSAAFVLARSNPLNTMRLWRASAGVSPFALPASKQDARDATVAAAGTVQSTGVPRGWSQGRRARRAGSVRWEDRRFQEKLEESSRMRNLCAGLTCFFLLMAVAVLAVVLTGSA